MAKGSEGGKKCQKRNGGIAGKGNKPRTEGSHKGGRMSMGERLFSKRDMPLGVLLRKLARNVKTVNSSIATK